MEYICLGWNDMIDFISIDGIIKVLEIQGENAKKMPVGDFLRGNIIKQFEKFN